MSNTASTQSKNVELITIDNIFDEMESWRESPDHKKGIPDELWIKIFKLARRYPEKRLRSIFSINSKQYKIKHDQLMLKKPKKLDDINSKNNSAIDQARAKPNFCEVKIAPSISDNVPPLTSEREIDKAKKHIKTLRSNSNDPESYLSLNTVIVECVHPNGQKLKIHTTNQSLAEVMQAFYHLKEVNS